MWFCDYRIPILCDLRRNPNCFYHRLNHFASGIIVYTLKETFHRITALLRSKIITNEFEFKLKNLGNIQGTFTMNRFKFLDFSLGISPKYLFDYSKVFNLVIFHDYPLDASYQSRVVLEPIWRLYSLCMHGNCSWRIYWVVEFHQCIFNYVKQTSKNVKTDGK